MENSRLKHVSLQIFLNSIIAGVIILLGVLSQNLAANYENILLPLYIPAGFSFYFLYKKPKYNTFGVFLGSFIETYIFLSKFPISSPVSFVLTVFFVAVANTIQPFFASLVIEKYCQNHDFLHDTKTLGIFIFSTVIFCLCAGIIGSFAVILGNYVDVANLFPSILNWAISDAAAMIIISPVLLHLKNLKFIVGKISRKLEYVVFFLCTSVFQLFILICPNVPVSEFNFDYLVILLIAWSAIRFSIISSLFHVLFISISTVSGIHLGTSHFLQSDLDNSLVMVQIYLFVIAFTNLLMICLISERKRNYRKLKAYSKDLEQDVEKTLSKIKKLTGILPICSKCKKIRDENGEWHILEQYIDQHSEAQLSHGYCDECMEKFLKELDNI